MAILGNLRGFHGMFWGFAVTEKGDLWHCDVMELTGDIMG